MLMAVTEAMEALQSLNLNADEWQELAERVEEKAQAASEFRYTVDLMTDAENDVLEEECVWVFGEKTARLFDEVEGGIVAYGHVDYINKLAAHLEANPIT